jgi:cation:H+ antiporter
VEFLSDLLAPLSSPSLPVAIVEVLVGLFLLTRAADRFVDGSVGLASAARVSPVVIGAVIIGFGTSMPELLVSGFAAADGKLDIGVGNVVGSNVANLTLVLGAAAMLVPVPVARAVLFREAPIALVAVLLFATFTLNGSLGQLEGLVLLVVLAAVLTWIIVGGRLPEDLEVSEDGGGSVGQQTLATGIGLIGTVVGAQLLVWGAESIAERIGISGGLVGFTLVAVGTSLPELVTAVAAARQGQTALLLGNLLGSNMFNSLAVGGVISIVGAGPIDDPSIETIGVGTMVLVAIAVWAFMATGRKVTRWEASVLLAVWFASVVLMAGGGDDAEAEEASPAPESAVIASTSLP